LSVAFFHPKTNSSKFTKGITLINPILNLIYQVFHRFCLKKPIFVLQAKE